LVPSYRAVKSTIATAVARAFVKLTICSDVMNRFNRAVKTLRPFCHILVVVLTVYFVFYLTIVLVAWSPGSSAPETDGYAKNSTNSTSKYSTNNMTSSLNMPAVNCTNSNWSGASTFFTIAALVFGYFAQPTEH